MLLKIFIDVLLFVSVLTREEGANLLRRCEKRRRLVRHRSRLQDDRITVPHHS
jgi:hypothetical protein